jgi:hypothetical protein
MRAREKQPTHWRVVYILHTLYIALYSEKIEGEGLEIHAGLLRTQDLSQDLL